MADPPELSAASLLGRYGGTARDGDPETVRSSAELDLADKRQDIGLKRLYAKSVLIGLGVQVLIADWGFFLRDRPGLSHQ